jgi:hypothetical protein
MEENNFAAGFQREGEITFPTETNSDETAADSQSEKGTETDTQSSEGDNTQTEEDKLPFHKNPRWTQRETEWNQRFNDQEKRHQDDLKSIREEFKEARKDNAEQTKIPSWFGGTQEQWDAYRADRDAELIAAEDRAEKRAIDKIKNERGSEDKAVKDATEYLHSEVDAIQADKVLNPTGAKIDAEKLLKIVLDNQLIDTKGRWNYRAGFKIMNGTQATAPAPKPKTEEKKAIADASTSNKGAAGGNDSKPSIATSQSFKNNRPW